MKDKKDCVFKIFIDRPKFMVSKEVRRRVNRGAKDAQGRVEELSATGHAFIGLADEKGVEKRFGLNADTFSYGPANVPPEDRIESLFKDAFKKVAGFIKDETGERYDDVIEYKITRKQYDQAMEFVDRYKREKKPYCLLLNNCTVFARKAAKACGIKPPPVLTGFHTPHGLSISIRGVNSIRRAEKNIHKIFNKIAKFFRKDKENVSKESSKQSLDTKLLKKTVTR